MPYDDGTAFLTLIITKNSLDLYTLEIYSRGL